MNNTDHKKVLIITYYWPPSGGGGVQRWLKFVKYLPSFGWHPYVYTPENPSVELRDETLVKDVPDEAEIIRLPIWEPYRLADRISALTGKNKASSIDFIGTGKKSFFSRMTTWARGNFFVPDPRVGWVKPSVQFLDDFIRTNKIKLIVTTGPPHSMHLIGLRLKKRHPDIHWIADFRDPWSEWDLLDSLSISAPIRAAHRRMERKVLTKADRVITIAPFHVKRFEELGGRKVDLITNGFDASDFVGVIRKRTSKFTIRHIGMVDGLRDPRPFMLAARALMQEDSAFASNVHIEFIGKVNKPYKDFVSDDELLSKVTVFSPPVSHEDLLAMYGETDIQLLVLAHTALAPGNLPGKIFEYLASGNFIFGIGPVKGDAADILTQTSTGVMVDRQDGERMKSVLKEKFDQWSSGGRVPTGDVTSFSRQALTGKLSELLREEIRD